MTAASSSGNARTKRSCSRGCVPSRRIAWDCHRRTDDGLENEERGQAEAAGTDGVEHRSVAARRRRVVGSVEAAPRQEGGGEAAGGFLPRSEGEERSSGREEAHAGGGVVTTVTKRRASKAVTPAVKWD